MTDKQSNSLDMYLVIDAFYIGNQVQIDTVPALATVFAQLQANITAINSNLGAQTATTKGVTQDKIVLRKNLDDLTFVMLAPARVWAMANDNHTLAEQFHASQSDIKYLKDDTVAAFCQLRLQLLNDNVDGMADYGLTPALVATWQTAIDDFGTSIGNPRSAIVSRSQNTKNLKELFKETSTLFTNSIDPLMVPFRATEPEMFSEYRKSRIIIDRGGSASKTSDPIPKPVMASLYGVLTDLFSLMSIMDVEGTLSPNNPMNPSFQTTSDAYGKYTFDDVPPGEYQLTFSHPNYQSFMQPVSLATEETQQLDIQMQSNMP